MLTNNPEIKAGLCVLKKLEKFGQAYFVGGCVRDIILEQPSHDIDIATNCPMKFIEEKFETFDIGSNKDFGILCIKQEGFDFEVAQFRTDGDYSNGRQPDSVQFVNDFKEDAQRRDFTINSMALDSKGNLLDYFGGIQDLKDGVIRTVGNPIQRFDEDYLRMLRAVRFSARFGFEIEVPTMNAIIHRADKIMSLSVERIRDELLKMAELNGDKFCNAIERLMELHLLREIIPEISKYSGSNDIPLMFSNLRKTGPNTEANIPILLNLYKIKERFDIAERLKFSKHLISEINFCSTYAGLDTSNIPKSELIQLMASPHWRTFTKFNHATSDILSSIKQAECWQAIQEQYQSTNPLKRIRQVITGDLVMKVCSIPHGGRMVGKFLEKTVAWIADNDIHLDNKDEIESYINSLK